MGRNDWNRIGFRSVGTFGGFLDDAIFECLFLVMSLCPEITRRSSGTLTLILESVFYRRDVPLEHLQWSSPRDLVRLNLGNACPSGTFGG